MCSRCKKEGHNIRGCKEPSLPTSSTSNNDNTNNTIQSARPSKRVKNIHFDYDDTDSDDEIITHHQTFMKNIELLEEEENEQDVVTISSGKVIDLTFMKWCKEDNIESINESKSEEVNENMPIFNTLSTLSGSKIPIDESRRPMAHTPVSVL